MSEDLVLSQNHVRARSSYPSVDSSSYPYSSIPNDILETKFQRKKSIGLCMNNLCSTRPRAASRVVYTKYTKGFTTHDKMMVDCPTCKTALYWTNNLEDL